MKHFKQFSILLLYAIRLAHHNHSAALELFFSEKETLKALKVDVDRGEMRNVQ
jgi:hypothetical protein